MSWTLNSGHTTLPLSTSSTKNVSKQSKPQLDSHDDRIAGLSTRIQQLTSRVSSGCSSTTESTPHRRLAKRLNHLERRLREVTSAVESIDPSRETDSCLLRQYEERLSGFRVELDDISRDILALDHDDESLFDQETSLSKALFDVCLKIKRLLQGLAEHPRHPDDKGGVKLPRLDVPTFDGNLVNWTVFWEQFQISVHSRSQLSNSEKLAYLKHALKEGAAKHTIDGLSGSGDHYEEAIDCLKKRFDRPRLIHQAHVQSILEVPTLKDGNGKELHRLHDTVSQHLRALKVMDYEPPGHFITSMLELKLDTTTLFEWHKYSQDSSTVPHSSSLLEFINLRAQASESQLGSGNLNLNLLSGRRPRHLDQLHLLLQRVSAMCVACEVGKHPLYACQKFKLLPHDQMVSILKNHDLCMNCLNAGHFVRQCPSSQRCRKCQKPHHTLLHLESTPSLYSTSSSARPSVSGTNNSNQATTILSHVAQFGPKSHHALLMTCRVQLIAPNGLTTQARGLLDSASSTSFISEHMAQCLSLHRSRQLAQIVGIGGISHQSVSQSIVNFCVTPVWSSDKMLKVEAVVVPKVTNDLPLHPISPQPDWQHLSDLQMADPNFGTPGKIDILLGVDIVSDVSLQCRRHGPPGTPTAFETCFGWVLAGAVQCGQPQTRIVSYHTSVLSGDDLLHKFWEVEELHTSGTALSAEEKSVVTHFDSAHLRDELGRFIVPLPRNPDSKPLGESRSLAVRRFLSLERLLRSKNQLKTSKR